MLKEEKHFRRKCYGYYSHHFRRKFEHNNDRLRKVSNLSSLQTGRHNGRAFSDQSSTRYPLYGIRRSSTLNLPYAWWRKPISAHFNTLVIWREKFTTLVINKIYSFVRCLVFWKNRRWNHNRSIRGFWIWTGSDVSGAVEKELVILSGDAGAQDFKGAFDLLTANDDILCIDCESATFLDVRL